MESLLNVMRQSAWLVIYPILDDNFALLFNSMKVRLNDGPVLQLFILIGRERSSFVCFLVHWGLTDDLHVLQISSGVVLADQGYPSVMQHFVSVVSWPLLLHNIKT